MLNAWGGGWDLGRNGSTDLHSYSPTGALQWKLQALNFEAIAAPDPATDGTFFTAATTFIRSAGGTFVANTVDPFTYPKDPRLDMNDYQRGQHFGQLVMVGGNRILVASGQNPGNFTLLLHAGDRLIANPAGSLPGKPFNTTLQVTRPVSTSTATATWAGLNGTNAITRYPMTGFDATGKPSGQAGDDARAEHRGADDAHRHQADSDTMILAQGLANNWDWTAMNGHIEVITAGRTATRPRRTR